MGSQVHVVKELAPTPTDSLVLSLSGDSLLLLRGDLVFELVNLLLELDVLLGKVDNDALVVSLLAHLDSVT